MNTLETSYLNDSTLKPSLKACIYTKFSFKSLFFLSLVFLSAIYIVSLVSKFVDSNIMAIYLTQFFNLGAANLSLMRFVTYSIATIELLLLMLLWFNKRYVIQQISLLLFSLIPLFGLLIDFFANSNGSCGCFGSLENKEILFLLRIFTFISALYLFKKNY